MAHKLTQPNRHPLGVVVIVLLATVLLSACSGSETAPLSVPAGARAGDLTRLEPCIYKTGDAEYTAECGTLSVPENRGDPKSPLIALPIKRIRATGSRPAEPIFWLNGGPGQSNMGFSHPRDIDALLEEHDFVFTGYRGLMARSCSTVPRSAIPCATHQATCWATKRWRAMAAPRPDAPNGCRPVASIWPGTA